MRSAEVQEWLQHRLTTCIIDRAEFNLKDKLIKQAITRGYFTDPILVHKLKNQIGMVDPEIALIAITSD